VRSAGNLGDKPLVVITAGTQSPDWLEMQDELAALSSESIHRVVDGATHESLLYERRDARVSSAAIVQVVEAARTGMPPGRAPLDEWRGWLARFPALRGRLHDAVAPDACDDVVTPLASGSSGATDPVGTVAVGHRCR
jgi:hypothetical protein